MKRFEFIFQGNEHQYKFFKKAVSAKLKDAELELDYIEGQEFNCSMLNDNDMIFKMGMLLCACYAKFEKLQGTIFQI